MDALIERSERCERALEAIRRPAMPTVIKTILQANIEDTARETDGCLELGNKKVAHLLYAMSTSYTDALIVVMYIGRDDYVDEHPYDEFSVDTEFCEWWDYLEMDREFHAREQMAEKRLIGKYLRRGAYMLRIDLGSTS